MLLEFKFQNFRSFRDETVLSLEATGLSAFKGSLIKYGTKNLLPGIAIFGKNGGGKSNVIRAFWLAVQFIKNAQRTQHENSEIPVNPFALNDYSRNEPTAFEFVYTLDDILYVYGFSATKDKIVSEYLYHSPNGQRALVFSRDYQKFSFTNKSEKARRTLISETVAENQLFFSVACTMNDSDCIRAMRWFREYVYFSRDYTDISTQIFENIDDKNIINAITSYAKNADIGILDMSFEYKSKDVSFPEDLPEGIKSALMTLLANLSAGANESEAKLKMGEIVATSFHQGIRKDGKNETYMLDVSDESDGTRKLMALAPAIETVLQKGGILMVDEIERELHPLLVKYIISKFQSKNTNKGGAQIVFTTHNTELMNLDIIRKDQLYFVDKDSNEGTSELYSISDFSTKTSENIRKGYIVGKYGATPDVEIEEVE